MDQLLLNILPVPQKNFENFVAGKNIEIVSTLQAFNNDSESTQLIFLWGCAGSGKSHLINSLTNNNIEKVEDIQNFNHDQNRHLFMLINDIKSQNKKLIITCDRSPDELVGIDEDLHSRLKWGLVLNLSPLTDEDKYQIIKIKSQENGYHIEDKVINYCLRHLRRDLHTLINTFQALDEWSLKSKRAITINLIKDLQRNNII